jgi:hypothetical protein
MPFVQDDHVIQQVASAASHPTLGNTVLPRTAKCRAHGLASHVFRGRNYIIAKFRVVVEYQEPVRRCIRPRFSHLLHDPKSVRISRDVETQNLSPVMADDKEAVQNAEGEDRYCEEVHRSDCLTMIPEERKPAFDGIRISRDLPKPSRDSGFRQMEAQLEQFA